MKVSIVKCNSYTEKEVDYSVENAINSLGGIDKFIKKDDKVLVKINQLFGKNADSAVTSNPSVVRAIVKLVRKAGGVPFIGDSPAIQSLEYTAKKTGIATLCQEYNVKLVELDSPIKKKVNGKVIKSFQISKRLDEFDKIINVPKLKTHSLTGMTGAVKNLFGCIPGRLKGALHMRFQKSRMFAEMLIDLQMLIKPTLNIMDAVIAMEGFGPGSGDPRKVGLIIASEDTVALDSVAAKIIGFKPNEVATIIVAQNRGIKEAFVNKIEIIGSTNLSIKNFKRARIGILPSFVGTIVRNLFVAKPVVKKSLCIHCGGCKTVCPAEAITYRDDSNKIPDFDYKKCIRCFCCHEICPRKAIRLKRSLIVKIFDKFVLKKPIHHK